MSSPNCQIESTYIRGDKTRIEDVGPLEQALRRAHAVAPSFMTDWVHILAEGKVLAQVRFHHRKRAHPGEEKPIGDWEYLWLDERAENLHLGMQAAKVRVRPSRRERLSGLAARLGASAAAARG